VVGRFQCAKKQTIDIERQFIITPSNLVRNLSELKINERGKNVDRRPPSDEIIKAFEAQFAIKLPENYQKFLRHSNGGHPELDSIESSGDAGNKWAVNGFYFLNEDKSSTGSFWAAVEKWRKILGNHALPIAADSGGNQFFLDLIVTPPSVKVCVHDENFSMLSLSPSFEAFIDGLSIDPNMI
jgi:hypothetical protein